MLSLPIYVVDDAGLDTTGEIEQVRIPDGWWVADVVSYGAPVDMFPLWSGNEHRPPEQGGCVDIFGVKSEQATWYVTKVDRIDRGHELWHYVVIGPEQFLLYWFDEYYYEPFYSIARKVKSGYVSKKLKDTVTVHYKRGSKGWGWVQLSELLKGLNRQISDLRWDLVSDCTAIPIEFSPTPIVAEDEAEDWLGLDFDFDKEFYSSICITISDPKSEILYVESPSAKSDVLFNDIVRAPGGIKKLIDFAPDEVWIPAGMAKNLMYLEKFL